MCIHAFLYSELHLYGLSDASQGVSSSEEEDLQAQFFFAGGASSRESVRTAVSERGHRWDIPVRAVSILYPFQYKHVRM